MRNLLFVLWLIVTMFIIPMVGFAIGYTEWSKHEYQLRVLAMSQLFDLISIIFVACLLYEPKEDK